MAIRLRCPGCNKKLSVDEGFAGSVCRCPYCASLVQVSEGHGGRSARFRPVSPVARSVSTRRPAAPTKQAPAAPAEEQPVPLANPVRIQGITAIVVLILAVSMAAGVGVLLVMYGPGLVSKPKPPAKQPFDSPPADVPPATQAPQLPPGPRVDEFAIQPPVLYCIASASNIAFDFAAAMTLKSIDTLGDGQQFQIALSYEDDCRFLSAGYVAKDAGAEPMAREFFSDSLAGSIKRVAEAVEAASKAAPKTVVIFVSDTIDDADVERIAAVADAAGASIVAIALTRQQDVIAIMQRLSQRPRMKGKWKSFDPGSF